MTTRRVNANRLRRLTTLRNASNFRMFHRRPNGNNLTNTKISNRSRIRQGTNDLRPNNNPTLLRLRIINRARRVFLSQNGTRRLISLNTSNVRHANMNNKRRIRRKLIYIIIRTRRRPFQPNNRNRNTNGNFVNPRTMFTRNTRSTIDTHKGTYHALLYNTLDYSVIPRINPNKGNRPRPNTSLLNRPIRLLYNGNNRVLPNMKNHLTSVPRYQRRHHARFIDRYLPTLIKMRSRMFTTKISATSNSQNRHHTYVRGSTLFIRRVPTKRKNTTLSNRVERNLRGTKVATLMILGNGSLPKYIRNNMRILRRRLLNSKVKMGNRVRHNSPITLRGAPNHRTTNNFFRYGVPTYTYPTYRRGSITNDKNFNTGRGKTTRNPRRTIRGDVLPRRHLLSLNNGTFGTTRILQLRINNTPNRRTFILRIPRRLTTTFRHNNNNVTLNPRLNILLLRRLIRPFLLFRGHHIRIERNNTTTYFKYEDTKNNLRSTPQTRRTIRRAFPVVNMYRGASLHTILFLSM